MAGRAYLFCYTPLVLRPIAALVPNFNEIVAGEALAPFAIEQKLQKRLRLLSMPGLIGLAMAGIDMAAWDALARAPGCRWCACSAASRAPCPPIIAAALA